MSNILFKVVIIFLECTLCLKYIHITEQRECKFVIDSSYTFKGPSTFDFFLFLPVATKFGQGNIFTSVCQELCSQGGSGPGVQSWGVSGPWGLYFLGGHYLGGL